MRNKLDKLLSNPFVALMVLVAAYVVAAVLLGWLGIYELLLP